LSECEFLIRPERILGGLEHFAYGGRLSVAGRSFVQILLCQPLPSWSEAYRSLSFECRAANRCLLSPYLVFLKLILIKVNQQTFPSLSKI
jgi:hypothetical protein